MNELNASLRIALANTYLMYAKAQSYHWNVEGMFFPMFHEFFGDLYTNLLTPIDDLAERIRTIDKYAPISLTEIVNSATIKEDQFKPMTNSNMINNLLQDNREVVTSLNKAFEFAEQVNNQGLMNLLAERMDAHAKIDWQLRSLLKLQGE